MQEKLDEGGCRRSLMGEETRPAVVVVATVWRRQGEAGMAAYFLGLIFFFIIWFSYLNRILF